ncbi:MAG: ABC transporter substrate-binding protein [Chloroflexi bacterium OHK40]
MRRSFLWLLRVVQLMCCTLLLAACASSGLAPAPTPAQPLPADAGGTLIMALGPRDPTTLDPALVGDVTSAFVVRQIFSGLVRLNNRLEVEPDLAEGWELSPDGRTYRFTLRPEARFADGTPITAEDVRYSLERAADSALAPFLPARAYLGDIVGVREKIAGQASTISGVEVLDERTLAITIDGPKRYFLSKLAHPTSYVVDRRAVEAGGERWTEQPNGSGPFMIERWLHDELLVLARNPAFYRAPAKLDRVRFLIGASANNPLVLYEQGELDISGVPSYALARVQDTSNPLSRELRSVPQLSVTYLGLNPTLPPFDDPLVREAFSLLIDRERLATVSLSGAAQPAYGILPPGMPGYDPAIAPVAADVERARALIAASRYGSPEQLPPIVAYGGWAHTLREVAEEALGIRIEVRDYEDYGDYLRALDEAQFQIFGSGWVADYPDPENFLDLLFRTGSGENHFGYGNPEVDALLDAAAVEADETRRHELYRQAERRILADAPVVPLYHDVDHTLVKPYVEGLEVTPLGILDLALVGLAR